MTDLFLVNEKNVLENNFMKGEGFYYNHDKKTILTPELLQHTDTYQMLTIISLKNTGYTIFSNEVLPGFILAKIRKNFALDDLINHVV